MPLEFASDFLSKPFEIDHVILLDGDMREISAPHQYTADKRMHVLALHNADTVIIQYRGKSGTMIMQSRHGKTDNPTFPNIAGFYLTVEPIRIVDA